MFHGSTNTSLVRGYGLVRGAWNEAQRSGEAVTGDQIKLADGAMKLNCNIRP